MFLKVWNAISTNFTLIKDIKIYKILEKVCI